MSDAATADQATDAPPRKGKGRVLILGLIAALLLGGGSFYAVYSGMIALPFGAAHGEEAAHKNPAGEEGHAKPDPLAPTAFVPIDEIIVTLGPEASARHLLVEVHLEVVPASEADVLAVRPRVMDVLNTFLRAVEERDLESPRAMLRLRAQMLRRVQLVTPEGAVRDLLIQKFVLN